MVQEYQSPVRVYKYPFEMVMAAYERRFPRCPQIPVVVECVVTEDRWSADNSQRHTIRRCQLNVDAPYLLKKMIGVDYVYFVQKNHLDLKNRVLNIQATNETFNSRVEVVEKCRYFVHPENPAWSCFEQSAMLDVKSFFGFEHAIEKIAMKQYSANIAKGKEIIDVFMRDVEAEGVTSLPQWGEGATVENASLRQVLCRGAAPVGCESPEHEDIDEEQQSCSQKTELEDKYKLESEYIKRFLGELTPMQESRLLQLRKMIAELQKSKVPNDQTLLRFLRARDFNVERAREMLSESLIWRKKHQVDKILSEYKKPKVVLDYFPGDWHHQDIDGRPLYILRLGQMDVKGLLKSIGEDGLLKLTLHVCEEGLNLLNDATRSSNRAVDTWSILVDLDGLNMRHLWRPGIRALLRIIQIVESNYPETMGRVLIVRAPRVFPILWTIVSTFIDENTRSKFLLYGGKDCIHMPGGLEEHIPKDVIPDFLGGPCKSFVREGGVVPKSLYVTGVFMDRSYADPLSEDSLYKTLSLAKGQVHEVIVENEDPGGVLTWDFDVMRHSINFTVFRADVQISNDVEYTDQGSCMPTVTDDALCRSVLEPYSEGQHYHKVDPTILCHDGESIQGSHVMSDASRYVLQWRHADSDCNNDVRAQLMYCFQALPATQYKGSMSSLQSATSGKSGNSSCPSR